MHPIEYTFLQGFFHGYKQQLMKIGVNGDWHERQQNQTK